MEGVFAIIHHGDRSYSPRRSILDPSLFSAEYLRKALGEYGFKREHFGIPVLRRR
jgi:hypothetical protein